MDFFITLLTAALLASLTWWADRFPAWWCRLVGHSWETRTWTLSRDPLEQDCRVCGANLRRKMTELGLPPWRGR